MLPKVLKEIVENQRLIMAHLGIAREEPTQATEPQPAEPPKLDPHAVAAHHDYESYAAREIIDRAPSLTDAERAALAEYEAANENRKTVLAALRGE